MADPSNESYYESFTCQTAYSRSSDFASPDSIIVRNYYGTERFSKVVVQGIEEAMADPSQINKKETREKLIDGFNDINFKDLVDD